MTRSLSLQLGAILLATIVCALAPTSSPASQANTTCPASQRSRVVIDRWSRQVRAAATPAKLSGLLARLRLALPAIDPDCDVTVLGVDRFSANLTGSRTPDQVVQVRMRTCSGERAASSLRIQVLRPMDAHEYCFLGDELSIDQRDSERLCDPDIAEAPEDCGQGSCACAPRVDPEATPPRTLSLIHLTHPTRQTIRVLDASGNGLSCCSPASGSASVSFWDVKDNHLIKLFSVEYKRLASEGSHRRVVETADQEQYPKPIHTCDVGEEDDAPPQCLGDEAVFDLKGRSYQRSAKPATQARSNRQSLLEETNPPGTISPTSLDPSYRSR